MYLGSLLTEVVKCSSNSTVLQEMVVSEIFVPLLERTYKPHYHYQIFSPLANGTGLNRENDAILQTH